MLGIHIHDWRTGKIDRKKNTNSSFSLTVFNRLLNTRAVHDEKYMHNLQAHIQSIYKRRNGIMCHKNDRNR